MPRVLFLDDEQADLLLIGAEIAHQALEARAARVDPDGIISASLNLSRLKLHQVMLQMERKPHPKWHEMEEATRTAILNICHRLIEERQPEGRNAHFEHLCAYLMGRLDRPLWPEDARYASKSPIRRRTMEIIEAQSEEGAEAVRKMREEQGG